MRHAAHNRPGVCLCMRLSALVLARYEQHELAATRTRTGTNRPMCLVSFAGLFLTFIGLQSSNGLGLITLDPATLVTLGTCHV